MKNLKRLFGNNDKSIVDLFDGYHSRTAKGPGGEPVPAAVGTYPRCRSTSFPRS